MIFIIHFLIIGKKYDTNINSFILEYITIDILNQTINIIYSVNYIQYNKIWLL